MSAKEEVVIIEDEPKEEVKSEDGPKEEPELMRHSWTSFGEKQKAAQMKKERSRMTAEQRLQSELDEQNREDFRHNWSEFIQQDLTQEEFSKKMGAFFKSQQEVEFVSQGMSGLLNIPGNITERFDRDGMLKFCNFIVQHYVLIIAEMHGDREKYFMNLRKTKPKEYLTHFAKKYPECFMRYQKFFITTLNDQLPEDVLMRMILIIKLMAEGNMNYGLASSTIGGILGKKLGMIDDDSKFTFDQKDGDL